MLTLTTIGAVAGSVAAIGVVIRGAWRANRRIIGIWAAVQELLPNGGGSLRDAVDRTEKMITDHLEDHRATRQP